ncbi:MAG: tRNA (adenosine(37)-N6)-dimethylallyltransferase MiaA [Ruminococcaceae bacterium]|nr:tRNA (adenosine(37)-N6)-dimethylallyltransferase MiaA [Oscillospiraceae bacterium]
MIRALAITGPTASGKTALSIGVAKALGCEIISLDSMQIYKYMDIGTAKATEEERAIIPHHMIDFLSPDESFSAKAYKDMAMECAKDIVKRGKIPLFVGGTGLYLSTLMRPDCEEPPESDPEYRRKIEETLTDENKKIELHERLRQIDPISAQSVHYNNTRRVIRALEIFDATGKTKTYFDALTKRKSDELELIHVTLDFHERENLYKRVDVRVDQMIKEGLLSEAEALIKNGYLKEDTTASQAIGYKELTDVVRGTKSLEAAIDEIKQFSRNYAKRQLTWFRHTDGANTLFVDNDDASMRSLDELLSECINIFSHALSV